MNRRQPVSMRKTPKFRSTGTAVIACLALLFASLLTACSGGGSNSGAGSTLTTSPKTTVEVNMGDSPADWMLAFSMNITSMSLTGSNGSVTILSSSTPIEMMHLMGTMQPLAMASVSQGTYTGASITIGSATVMYLDPTTKAPVQATIAGPMTANVTFNSPVTVGSTPMAIGFDLNLASSVTAGSGGTLSMNPVFNVSSGMQGSGNALDPASGGIQQMVGTVSSVTGSTFVMNSMQAAQSFTFATNSSTVFDGGGMSSMSSGMLVIVDATMQADGSMLATKVQSMMGSGGAMSGGIITAVTGQPPTSFTMVMQNGAGAGMMSSDFAAGATMDMNESSTYQIDEDNMDMSGLPFTPVFDASHVYAGQSVMSIGSGGMMSGGGGMMGGGSMSGSMTVSNLELEPQGLSGTVATTLTSGVATSFTLTLPSDSAFTTLTGASTVTVYQQTGTTMASGSSIPSGSTTEVFGLLFFDSGQWKMVASQMESN